MSLAQVAGEKALAHFRAGGRTRAQVDFKDGGSPVTEADRLVDDFLKAELAVFAPDAGWLSEETVDSDERLSRERLFIVDPIDGTRAFVAGDPRWAVCIALVERGRPTLGVIHLPARGETFSAALGSGAWRNGAPIRVASRPTLVGARVAGPAGLIQKLAVSDLHVELEPKVPSLAYRLARVAEGSLDGGVASTDANDWDIAAADVILHEAGGRLTDLDERTPSYNRKRTSHPLLAASAAHLQAGFVAALRKAASGASVSTPSSGG